LGCKVRPLATSSGTAAIELALDMIGIGPGDVVVTTPMTCIATNAPLVARGARIAWADVNPITGMIDPISAYSLVRAHDAKAIIAVDWGGQLCDYKRLREAGVPVIQDAAHVFEPDCCRGDYTCLSFQAIKPLTTGDGGALIPPEGMRQTARLHRWYGLDRELSAGFRCSQLPGRIGKKLHMNDIAASIGLANLPLAKKNSVIARDNAFDMIRNIASVNVIGVPEYRRSWWLFTLLVRRRDEFVQYMRENGIEVSPVHTRNDNMPGFWPYEANKSVGRDARPGVTHFNDHQVNIPCGWWLTPAERWKIIEVVNGW
jgi:dTDP-4-amino-4,6-dideoxygalactose transaminase